MPNAPQIVTSGRMWQVVCNERTWAFACTYQWARAKAEELEAKLNKGYVW
jgi:hypothetical protein